MADLSLRSSLWFLGARKKRPLMPWQQEDSLLQRVLGEGARSYKFPKPCFCRIPFLARALGRDQAANKTLAV